VADAESYWDLRLTFDPDRSDDWPQGYWFATAGGCEGVGASSENALAALAMELAARLRIQQ
jgi:hypothetical protein